MHAIPLHPSHVGERTGAVEPIRSTSGPFSYFADQLASIIRAGQGLHAGRDVDPRLNEINEVYQRAAAGSSEQVPSDGGFLIQPEFSRQLVKRMYLTGDIFARCFQIPVSRSNTLRFPQIDESSRVAGSRLGGVKVFFENEADTMSGHTSSPKLLASEVPVVKIIGLLYVTDELLIDSDALAAWAEYAFTLELLFALENKFINGSGAGAPLGIINAGALVSITKEGGQGAGTVVSQNVIKMMGSLWAPSRKNAVWLYNQQLLPQLSQLTTVVGAAGSIAGLWQFALDDNNVDRLCGVPAFPSEYCAAPGTVGDLILADFSRYVVAMRERRTDISIHLNFLSDESAFRFVLRAGGQPIDTAPVTPANGTNSTVPYKTSPFVALGAR